MQFCSRLSLTAVVVTACLGRGVAAPRAQEPALGREFTLAQGRSIRVAGTSLSMAFVKVTDDSRCPKEARCITAGDATVHLSLVGEKRGGGGASGGGKPVTVMLHTERSREVTHEGLTIALTDLQPATSLEKPIAQKDYVVTLRVTR